MMPKLALLFLAISATGTTVAQTVSIPAPQRRSAAIESVAKWVDTAPRTFLPEQKNPFSMKGFEITIAAAAATEARVDEAPADENLLSTLAEMIEARGRFVMNGEVMLLVGRNKLRVGSKVPVSYGGLVYELEIAAIDTTKFTVRYKSEEFTRPITQKTPSKKP
ncbi:MAG: hypothetical protein SFV32_04065 [Opitutaceae bacterium]|nr:hypothetical protein [Opitutaceae bacterium]